MSEITRSNQELFIKFNQQVDLLKLAHYNFDSGKEVAALNIATALRVLLHDTGSSTSALTHIGQKNISFFETCLDDRFGKGVYLGLVFKYFSEVQDGVGGEASYKPTFTSDFHFTNKSWTDFNSWWHKIIFRSSDNSSLDRKELVLTLANKDGGAHIEKKISQKFDRFRHNYSGGVKIFGTKSGIERQFDNVPVLPAVRQIGFEVIESFIKAGLI